MESVAPAPVITSGDRLGLTLFFAVVLHAIVVLGVTFSLVDRDATRNILPTLEITLVQHQAERPPEQADYLAQTNQVGGGDSPEKVRPSNPLPKPLVAPKPAPPVPQATLTPPPKVRPTPPRRKVMTRAESERKVMPKPAKKPVESAPVRTPPTAAQLITRSMQIASLSAEIDERQRAYAKRPRHRYISANTREYKYASYMEAWRAKVERIGNLNYPEEAKRRKLTGNLLLDVVLNADGTIDEIVVRRSSGHKTLDDAAVRIVRLAAPFAPFPEDISKETDVLHITRTWQFLQGNRLYSK